MHNQTTLWQDSETPPLSDLADTRSLSSAPGEVGAEELGEFWRHPSGLVLPRGTLITSVLTDRERAALDEASIRRGVRAWEKDRGKVRRSAEESLSLDEFCIWLNRYGFDVFFSITFSPEYAACHSVRSLAGAVRDVRRGLSECGYFGRVGLSAEMTDREIPHVHGALCSSGDLERLVCPDSPSDGELWRYFFGTRGRSRFEPMRDQDESTLYAFKDTFKKATEPGALYIRLRPIRGLRNDHGRLTDQDAIFATRTAKRIRAENVVGVE